MEILAIKVFFFKWRLRKIANDWADSDKNKKIAFLFSLFFLFLSDLNCSIRRRFTYVLVKTPLYASGKKPEIWNNNSRSTTDPKNLKISQCFVTMTYNTQYFFHQNRWGTATKNLKIPWNGPSSVIEWKRVMEVPYFHSVFLDYLCVSRKKEVWTVCLVVRAQVWE
jgi:hypothetical protein